MINLEYLYNPEAAKKILSKNHFSDKKLGFRVIDKGTILPHKDKVEGLPLPWGGFGGVLDSNGKYVKDSLCPGVKDSSYPVESIQYSAETVIYIGAFLPVWGHFLTDSLRFIWFLHSKEFNQFKNCRIVYIPWSKSPLKNHPDYVRILEILGLSFDRLCPVDQPTQFERIIIPEMSFLLKEGFTNEYRETIDILRNFALKNRTPISNKKLYFYYGSHKQIGEERIAEYFKSKGYDIITHAQRLNIDEQLNRLINCEVFVSPLGSCGLNEVFTRNGTEVICIPRAYMQLPEHFPMLAQVSLSNVTYIDSSMSLFNRKVSTGFCFIISKQLKQFFGDKFDGYEEGDFKAFLDYVNSAPVRKGESINSLHEKGYGAIIQDFMNQLKQRKDLIATYNMPLDWDKFRSNLTYMTYVRQKSWSDNWKNDNQPSNPLDQQLEISAIQINHPDYKVYYSVYYNEEEGWTKEVSSSAWAGITSRIKPIFGIKIRLDESGSKEFDIFYRVHKFDGNWTDWAKNGEELQSHGVKLNAIQIKLEPVVKAQSDEVEQKKLDDTSTPQPDDTLQKIFDATWTLEIRSDDSLYLQNQRQDITQIKL